MGYLCEGMKPKLHFWSNSILLNLEAIMLN